MNRLGFVANSLIQLAGISHQKKIRKKSEQRVLVLFMPFIGDFLMYLNALNELTKWYQQKGYQVDVAILKQNQSLVKQYCLFDDVLVFDQKQYMTQKSYRKEIQNWMAQKRYGVVINPYFDTLLDADILAVLSQAPERILADRRKYYSDSFLLMKKLKNRIHMHAYTKRIVYTEKVMDFRKTAYFLQQLGIPFQAQVSYLPPLQVDVELPAKSYCVLAPGASKTGKRWEPEKFAQMADYIVSQYGLQVCICGTAGEQEIAEQILSHVKGETRQIINCMGKYSMAEYIELIRHAKVVLTNDSAPVHIASATGTRSVCIIGGWDYKRLIPYQIEVETPGTVVPDYVYSGRMPCFNCFDIRVAYGNQECAERIQKQETYPCIASISVSDVQDVLDQVMKEVEE